MANAAQISPLIDLLVEAVLREIHGETTKEKPEGLQGNPRARESEVKTIREVIARYPTQSRLSVEEPVAAEGQRG